MASIGEVYRVTRKAVDLPWNVYVCRPIAAVIVAAVQTTRITPNQITLASVPVAVLSAALLVLMPGTIGLVVAVLVFELSYVLDCADGMLARLRGGGSTEGHLLDFLMDELKAFVMLAAVSVRLWLDEGRDERMLLLGLFGVVALATGVALTTFLRRPEIAPNSAAPAPERAATLPGRAVRVAEAVARQLIHYPSYIWLPAVLGRLDWFMYPYVAVNAAYAVRALAQVALRFGRARER